MSEGSEGAVVLRPHRIAAARVAALARVPYFATPLLAAPVVAAPGTGTIAIDRRWRLHCDPQVAEAMAAPELGALFVHLVAHVLRDHAGRLEAFGSLDSEEAPSPATWNSAADAEINDDLSPIGLQPPVADLRPEDLGAPAGQLAETYYARARGVERRWRCGPGCDGTDDDQGDGDVLGLAAREAEWLRVATAAACQRAEQTLPGSVPGGWLRWAEGVLPSKVDWRRVLAAEIRTGVAHARGMVDYRYARPSRRAEAAPDVVLAVLEQPVPEVAIVCDTSGSMGADELARVLAEVDGILRRVGVRHGAVPVLACDTTVHVLRRVRRRADVVLAGGGGTDMGVGITAAAALRPCPNVIVVLTDGMTPWPEKPPPSSRVVAGVIRPRGRQWTVAPPRPWARVVDIEA